MISTENRSNSFSNNSRKESINTNINSKNKNINDYYINFKNQRSSIKLGEHEKAPALDKTTFQYELTAMNRDQKDINNKSFSQTANKETSNSKIVSLQSNDFLLNSNTPMISTENRSNSFSNNTRNQSINTNINSKNKNINDNNNSSTNESSSIKLLSEEVSTSNQAIFPFSVSASDSLIPSKGVSNPPYISSLFANKKKKFESSNESSKPNIINEDCLKSPLEKNRFTFFYHTYFCLIVLCFSLVLSYILKNSCNSDVVSKPCSFSSLFVTIGPICAPVANNVPVSATFTFSKPVDTNIPISTEQVDINTPVSTKPVDINIPVSKKPIDLNIQIAETHNTVEIKKYESSNEPSKPSILSKDYIKIEKEFETRLVRESAKQGTVQISLMWFNRNDLDLHVIDPFGEEIFFQHKQSRSLGELDVDMNAGGDHSETPVENMFWPCQKAPTGEYKVFVKFFAKHTHIQDNEYKVIVKCDDNHKIFMGKINKVSEKQFVYSFKR